uniref:eIF-4F 25 kDa subunit n=1 Tax=Steinernema glaseri TaxID=37863 RepID=A0A1I7ZAB7_9BILA
MDLTSLKQCFPVVDLEEVHGKSSFCVAAPGNFEETMEEVEQLVKASAKEREFEKHRKKHLMVEKFVQPQKQKPGLQVLDHTFVMWYLERPKNREWKECVKELAAFQSLQGFFAMYNAISPPSLLRNGHDYMLFKEGVKPMWEDDKNRKGGRWRVSIDVQRKERLLRTDSYWYELMLAFIRGDFTDDAEVLGIVVNRRAKADKISVWTRDANNKMANKRIGNELKVLLDIPNSESMVYTRHEVLEEAA